LLQYLHIDDYVSNVFQWLWLHPWTYKTKSGGGLLPHRSTVFIPIYTKKHTFS